MKRLKMLFITIVAIVVTLTLLLQMTAAAAAEKVTICHKPGTPAELTLEVSVNALPAHLAHGDYEGECTDVTVLTCPFEAAIPVMGPDLVMYVVENPTESDTEWCMSSVPEQFLYLWGPSDPGEPPDPDYVPGFEICTGGPEAGSVYDVYVGKTAPEEPDFVQNVSCTLVP